MPVILAIHLDGVLADPLTHYEETAWLFRKVGLPGIGWTQFYADCQTRAGWWLHRPKLPSFLVDAELQALLRAREVLVQLVSVRPAWTEALSLTWTLARHPWLDGFLKQITHDDLVDGAAVPDLAIVPTSQSLAKYRERGIKAAGILTPEINLIAARDAGQMIYGDVGLAIGDLLQ